MRSICTLLGRWVAMLSAVLLTCLGCQTSQAPLLIVYDPAWRPLHLMGAAPNLNGYMIELWPLIAEQAHVPLELLQTGSNLVLRQIALGEARGGLTTQDPLPELREHFDFSAPLLLTGTTLVRRVEGPKVDAQHLAGVVIGVERDSQAFRDLVLHPDVIFRQYVSSLEALQDLVEGSLDAVALPRLQGLTYTHRGFGQKLEVVDPPINPQQGIRFVMRKGDPEFSAIVKAFEAADPRELQKKWRLAP